MRKALTVAGMLLKLLRDHPPVAAAAASVGAMALARFGFNVDADTLMAVGGPVVATANGIVWFLVSPTSKLPAASKGPDSPDKALRGGNG